MSNRKKPMDEQAVPQWGSRPWMNIPDESTEDPVFETVADRLEKIEEATSKGLPYTDLLDED